MCVCVCGCKSRSGGVVCPGCLNTPEQSAQHSRRKWSVLSLLLGGACHNTGYDSPLHARTRTHTHKSAQIHCTLSVKNRSDHRLEPRGPQVPHTHTNVCFALQ